VLGSLADEMHGGRYGEVASHLSPHVLKLILPGPDIRSGARDPVLAV
jgi:hypothetical protein